MTKEDVERMLKNYNEFRGRCAYLEALIAETEKTIERMKEALVEDSIKITAQNDGMPHTQKGSSDPTGLLGAQIASGYESEHIKQAEIDLAAYRQELEQKAVTIKFVDAWLLALELKERFIVEQKVLGGLSWRQMVFVFKRQFGDEYSQEGLKRLKQSAIEKICAIA